MHLASSGLSHPLLARRMCIGGLANDAFADAPRLDGGLFAQISALWIVFPMTLADTPYFFASES